jgi:hypothetical protein
MNIRGYLILRHQHRAIRHVLTAPAKLGGGRYIYFNIQICIKMRMNIFASKNIDSQVEAMLHQAHRHGFRTDRRWQVVFTISCINCILYWYMQIIYLHNLAWLHKLIIQVILHVLCVQDARILQHMDKQQVLKILQQIKCMYELYHALNLYHQLTEFICQERVKLVNRPHRGWTVD